jgi:hypothetical protein
MDVDSSLVNSFICVKEQVQQNGEKIPIHLSVHFDIDWGFIGSYNVMKK